MPSFDAWDIVRVPFPYTDRPVRQRRPALVIASVDLQAEHGLLWVLMITSAENAPWSGDVRVSDLFEAGLPAASVVRTAKIATIETSDADRVGQLPEVDRAHVREALGRWLTAA
jgi:mRNA interferase MazF